MSRLCFLYFGGWNGILIYFHYWSHLDIKQAESNLWVFVCLQVSRKSANVCHINLNQASCYVLHVLTTQVFVFPRNAAVRELLLNVVKNISVFSFKDIKVNGHHSRTYMDNESPIVSGSSRRALWPQLGQSKKKDKLDVCLWHFHKTGLFKIFGSF